MIRNNFIFTFKLEILKSPTLISFIDRIFWVVTALLRTSERLCVKAVTEPDSVESTENTERPGPNLRKIANKYDLLLPVSSGTCSICKVC